MAVVGSYELELEDEYEGVRPTLYLALAGAVAGVALVAASAARVRR